MAGSFQGGGAVVAPGGSFQGGGAAVPPPAAAPPTGHDPFFGHIMQGLTFGLSDEASAATNASARWLYNTLTNRQNAPSFGEDYAKVLADNRGELAQYAKEHPAAAMTAELGGALLTGGAGASRVMGAKVLAKVPGIVKAAGLGGAAAGAAGFGAGEGGAGPRLENAIIPAAVGAVGGAVLPPIMAAGGKLLSAVTTRFRPAATLADRKIAQALERDQLSPQDAAARLIALGPDATLADVGGRSMTRLARGTAGSSQSAEDLATKVYEARQAGQADRVSGEAGRTISPNQDFYGTIDDLTKVRKDAAAPLYEKAYQAGDMFSDQLSTLVQRPSMKQALGRAYRIAAEEGRDPTTLGLVMGKDGQVALGKVPTMQTWDYVKRGLDDGIEQFRDKVTGKLNLDEGGRADNSTRAALLGELDHLNPDYAAARAAYAGPSQSLDALAFGRGLFGKDSEITAKRIAGMTDGDKAFFRAGVVRALKDRVESAPDGANAVRRIFGSKTLREKLRAAFPDEASFADFERTMDRESRFYLTRKETLQGARSAPMLKDMQDIGDAAIPYAVDAVKGNVPGLIDRTVGALWARATTPSARVSDQLGPRLFSQDPNDTAALLARLGMRPPPRAAGIARRVGIATGLADTAGLQFGR